MSSEELRKLSSHDIQRVQSQIEVCLQQYMNKKEVMNALSIWDNIDPHFTELVWQRLEEENQEFFKAYYLKLLVKDQIDEFNRLLSEQARLMHQVGQSGISPMLTSNGLHLFPRQQVMTMTTCAPESSGRDETQPKSKFDNGTSARQPAVGFAQSSNMDVSPNLFVLPNSDKRVSEKINGKPERGSSGSSFNINTPSNFLEPRPLMRNASVSSFNTMGSNSHSQHLTDSVLDTDSASFGFLPQLPHSFSLPVMAADFASSSGLLDGYCRPLAVAAEASNFLDPHGEGERLEYPDSESLRFQSFRGF